MTVKAAGTLSGSTKYGKERRVSVAREEEKVC